MARSKADEAASRAEVSTQYRAWLKEEGAEDSTESKAIFALRMTGHGQHTYHGLTEKGINIALGGDPFYID